MSDQDQFDEAEQVEPDDVGGEVEVREPPTEDRPSRNQAVERGTPVLVTFAADLRLAYGAAVSLVKTSFVPRSYQGRPEEAAAAMVKGLEIGFTPMASLSEINVIQGTPALSALSMRAVLQSKGHQVWVEESTKERAIVKGVRRGEERVQESVWSMDRARGLGLAGKDNWKKQPTAMLVARATSELARLIAADDLLGIGYSAEELGDEAPVVVVEEKRPSKRVSRKRVAPAEPERKPVAAEPEAAVPEADEPVEAAVTDAPAPERVEGEAVTDEPSEKPAAGELEGFADMPDGFDGWE